MQEEVAIKTLREDYIPTNREEFLREARLMMALNHHCIVKIIGLSEGPPLLMVSKAWFKFPHIFIVNSGIEDS